MPRHKKNRSAARKAAPQPAAAWSSSMDRVGLALVLLTTLVIYWPALHGGLVWDDDANVTRPDLQSLSGLYRIWFDPAATAADAQYYPVVHTAFWIEHKLWGDAYVGFHLVNVFWHSIAVLLVYSIVNRLQIPGALLAAAIFAVHPVMVESVAWMTEQKNTLSTVLYLSAMLAYLKWSATSNATQPPAPPQVNPVDNSIRPWQYALSITLFALALLAKTATVTFPVALLIILWWQRGALSVRRDVLPVVPFFALSVAAGLMTIWVETKLVGAEGSEFELTFVQRFLLAGRDIWFYLGKLVWPTSLSFTYTRWNIEPSQWWQWTYSIAALAATIILWTIRRRWRGPLAAWLFFCGSLFPVLGFVNVYMFRFTFVADHLQYLPSLGIIVLVSAGIAIGLTRASLPVRWGGVGLCVAWLMTLTTLSHQQSKMYADIFTLYQTTLELNPGSWMAHNNLGLELAKRGKMDEAIKHYRSSIELNTKSISARNNLGRALTDKGQIPEAIAVLRDALAIKPDDPIILNSLGIALIHSNKFTEAREPLERALAIKPDYAECYINMGLVYRLTGHPAQAIESFRSALRLNAGYMQAYAGLAQALAATGQLSEAIAMAKKSIELADSTGQPVAAKEMTHWLNLYQSELAKRNAASPSP